MGIRDWLALIQKMLPYTTSLARWALLSSGHYGGKFKDPFLWRAVTQMFSWDKARS